MHGININGFWLIIPIGLIRYGLLWLANPQAMRWANVFPPMVGKHGQTALWTYMITNTLLIVTPAFLRMQSGTAWFYVGLVVYLLGVTLYAGAVGSFGQPDSSGLRKSGLYRLSRNPMYVSYFVAFLGVSLLLRSWWYIVLLAVFQVSVHWLILAEESWCAERFGREWQSYARQTSRYL